MRGLLVLLIVAIGLMAALYSRFAGLLLYTWFSFFRPQEWSWGAIASLRLSRAIGFFFVVSCLVTGVMPNLSHPISLSIVAFYLLGVISHFQAVNPAASYEGLDMAGRMIVTSLLAITLITTRRKFLLAMVVMAGSLAFHGAKFGVGYVIRGGARFNAGIGGMFSDNNDFALAIARIVYPLVAFAQNSKAWWLRAGVTVATPLCVLAVVSTFSRGGFLAIAVATLTFIVVQKKRMKVLAGLAVLLGLAYAFVPIPEEYYVRLDTISASEAEAQQEGSALGRLHFWEVAVLMAKDRPLGVGLRGFPSAYDRYDFSRGAFGTSRAVHSSHFQAMGELGWPGLAIWVAMHGLALWTLLKIRRRGLDPARPLDQQRFLFTAANGLFASEVAFLVGGSFLSQALNDLNWMTLALVAALDRLSLRADMDEEPVQHPALRPPAGATAGPRAAEGAA
jgi:probable O-glycosylation ligase (exosortase A-associated)